MKFSEAISAGTKLAAYEPGLAQRFKLRPSKEDEQALVLHADAAGLALLGQDLMKPEDARKYLPLPLWDIAIKARLWKAFPQLCKPWRTVDPKTSAYTTLLRMCQAEVPLEKIIAWVKVLGG